MRKVPGYLANGQWKHFLYLFLQEPSPPPPPPSCCDVFQRTCRRLMTGKRRVYWHEMLRYLTGIINSSWWPAFEQNYYCLELRKFCSLTRVLAIGVFSLVIIAVVITIGVVAQQNQEPEIGETQKGSNAPWQRISMSRSMKPMTYSRPIMLGNCEPISWRGHMQCKWYQFYHQLSLPMQPRLCPGWDRNDRMRWGKMDKQ